MNPSHPIKVWSNNQIKQIECSEDENLLDAMRRQGIPYYSDCGGRGSCGKCKIRIIEDTSEPGPEDGKRISVGEHEEGYRLACRVFPKKALTIELMNYAENIEAVTSAKDMNPHFNPMQGTKEEYAIGIDLGTTTLAFQIVNCYSGVILVSRTSINPQRRLGADVISRMKASNDGRREQLRQLILEALLAGIEQLCIDASVSPELIPQITIAGNTTMVHLLMGYSCEELGRYPFQPVHIGTIEQDITDFFGEVWKQRSNLWEKNSGSVGKMTVTVLPGISAFVGSDIVAGLGLCGFDYNEKICLFLDLGTNGELAIGNRDKLLVSSTAAGPAFEGGNISIGTGSVPGAISKLSLSEGKLHLETIGDQKPVGICGTGVIELCSELFGNGIMDTTGLLQEEYFEEGFLIWQEEGRQLRFLQRDIRELQLAKAAIRAGIELLIKSYGCSYEAIDKVYLAGGFGYVLPVDKAVRIGLLPQQLEEKVNPIGNSSLAGAIRYAIDPNFPSRLNNVVRMAKEMHIANQEEFQEYYIRYMNFTPEEEDEVE